MKTITIPIEVPGDVLVNLNETEQELKDHFQLAVAMMLFQEGKLSIGKAIQFSGLSRYEFEKSLAKNKIPLSNDTFEQVMEDFNSLSALL